MNPRTSPCTPPANPGSAAVVAHASESSGGACISCSAAVIPYVQSEQARYLQQCRIKREAVICRYGPSSKEAREADSYCRQEAGYLISGESGSWGYA